MHLYVTSKPHCFDLNNLSLEFDVSGQHFKELPGFDHLPVCEWNSIFSGEKRLLQAGPENSLLKLRVFFIPKITMLVLRILALRRNFSKVMLN